jgi:hypothetical protein
MDSIVKVYLGIFIKFSSEEDISKSKSKLLSLQVVQIEHASRLFPHSQLCWRLCDELG